jgi:hypothetical protein
MRIEFMPFLVLFKPRRRDTFAFEGFIKSLDGGDLGPAGFTLDRPLGHRVN